AGSRSETQAFFPVRPIGKSSGGAFAGRTPAKRAVGGAIGGGRCAVAGLPACRADVEVKHGISSPVRRSRRDEEAKHKLSSPAWRSHWRGKMSARPLAAVADRWGKKEMNEIEFSALMVSRVCHDLVGPMGAVI